MGAQNFTTTAFGKDAREAFAAAVRDAAHMNGHGGYTGTIAEKSDFVELPTPKRIDPRTFITVAENIAFAHDEDERVAQSKKLPPSHRSNATHAARLLDDKWGPAACFKLPYKYAQAYREAHDLKGKQGDVFVFFGLASS